MYDDANYIKSNYCKFKRWTGSTFVSAVGGEDDTLTRMCNTLDSMKTDSSTLDKFYVVSNGPKFGILSASNISSNGSYIIFFIMTYNFEKQLHTAVYRSTTTPQCQVNRIQFA